MFERDYLLKILVSLAAAIRKSLEKARGEKDFSAAVNYLENSISDALDLDGEVLLTLSANSISQVLKVSQIDPRVVVYVAHSMLLQSYYFQKLGNFDLARLRENQAKALATSYDFELNEGIDDLEDFNEDEFINNLEEITR